MADHELSQPWFNGDPRHIAAPLHKALGDMVIAFLQEQRCSIDDADILISSEGQFAFRELVGEVPSVRGSSLLLKASLRECVALR